MGVALIAGAFLARAKRYTGHGICQAAVLLLNLIMIRFLCSRHLKIRYCLFCQTI
jgi:hypothetical protein